MFALTLLATTTIKDLERQNKIDGYMNGGRTNGRPETKTGSLRDSLSYLNLFSMMLMMVEVEAEVTLRPFCYSSRGAETLGWRKVSI